MLCTFLIAVTLTKLGKQEWALRVVVAFMAAFALFVIYMAYFN